MAPDCREELGSPGERASSRAGSSPSTARPLDLRSLVRERNGTRATLGRRYQVQAQEIRTGGYGSVFVAEDREVLGRRVAVKKILATGASKRRSFDNEVALMKRLDHPNICKILETHVNGRILCIVMEFCEGGDVFDRITTDTHLSESVCADVIRQVAAALKYAHGRGVAHRDVKPENVCFASEDPSETHVKVIDWGAAHYFGDSQMQRPVGSLVYAAPEMRQAEASYGASCDLWSLGVTAYVALSGAPPFWGTEENQLACMTVEDYPLAEGAWNGISNDAKDLVKGLLKANPESRLSIDEVLCHPWLRERREPTNVTITRQVLSNMHAFRTSPKFFRFFVASVTKQLAHDSLQDLYHVFCDMDRNGDGVLDFNEVKQAFEGAFGAGSEQVVNLEDVFAVMDIDGSGTIDYTEFCAAALGELTSAKEDAVYAAFNELDLKQQNSVEKERPEVVKRFRQAPRTCGPLARPGEEAAQDAAHRPTSFVGKACALLSGVIAPAAIAVADEPLAEKVGALDRSVAVEAVFTQVAWGSAAHGFASRAVVLG